MIMAMRLNIETVRKNWSANVGNMIANPALLLPALPTFLILVAITLLSYETVDLFYKVITLSSVNQSGTKNATSSRLVTDSALRSSRESYNIIIERNLFLSTLKEISDKPMAGSVLSPGQEAAAIDLRGTIDGGPSFGYVIVEEPGRNKQRLYRLGDMIGSAKLIKIMRNMAIVKSGGREITLKIKETPLGSALPRLQTPQAPGQSLPQIPPEQSLPQLPPGQSLPQLPQLPPGQPLPQLPQLPPGQPLPQLPPAKQLPPGQIMPPIY